jgi:hypothetical protein
VEQFSWIEIATLHTTISWKQSTLATHHCGAEKAHNNELTCEQYEPHVTGKIVVKNFLTKLKKK